MNDEGLNNDEVEVDAAMMTQEEAIKCIEEVTRRMPTKVVRTQADIDEFYED